MIFLNSRVRCREFSFHNSKIMTNISKLDGLISGVSDLGMVDRNGLGIVVVRITLAVGQKGLRLRCCRSN